MINCILLYTFLVLRIQLWTKPYVSLFAYLFLLIASSIRSYTPSPSLILITPRPITPCHERVLFTFTRHQTTWNVIVLPLLPWILPSVSNFNWCKCTFIFSTTRIGDVQDLRIRCWARIHLIFRLENIIINIFHFLLNKHYWTRGRIRRSKRRITGIFAGVWLSDFTFRSNSG